MSANQWNLLTVNHVENAVTIVDQMCHAMCLHCYHMNAEANDSADFANQPKNAPAAIDRCSINALDVPVLWHANTQSNCSCKLKDKIDI